MAQCSYILENGRQCKANALRNDTRCLNHSRDPKAVATKTKAVTHGGLNSRHYVKPVYEPLDITAPTSIAEAEAILAKVIEATANGKCDPRVADKVTSACNAFIKAQQIRTLEARIAKLESERE